MHRLVVFIAWLTLLGGCAGMPDDASTPAASQPSATLAFFGLRPQMTVVEVWPGSGRHTTDLATALHDRGKLYAATLDPAAGDYARSAVDSFRARLALDPQRYSQISVTHLGSAANARQIAPPASADMVVTFDALHQWMMLGLTDTALAAIHAALKPGGIFGIVGHRGDPGPQDPKATSGYVDETYAIELIEAAGFRLSARSQLNANPADHHQHVGGVWSLPPSYSTGEVARHRAIGPSDRFTLRFIKITP